MKWPRRLLILLPVASVGLMGADAGWAGSDRAQMHVSARVVARCAIGVTSAGFSTPVGPDGAAGSARVECRDTQPVRVTIEDLAFAGHDEADIAARLRYVLAVQVDAVTVGELGADRDRLPGPTGSATENLTDGVARPVGESRGNPLRPFSIRIVTLVY